MADNSLHTIKFVKAVKEDDKVSIDEFSRLVIPRLIEYLMTVVKANRFHAEECAHQAFSVVLDRIIKDQIGEDVGVLAYMLATARNEYFATLKKESREGSAVFQEQYLVAPAEQIENLLDMDRKAILQQCIRLLDPKSRDFIEYIIQNPDSSMLKISRVFNISPENARTKKSRIVHELTECFKKKSML